MKIIALLIVMLLGFGAICKQSLSEQKEIAFQHELNQYKSYPNLLPVVEVVAPRS